MLMIMSSAAGFFSVFDAADDVFGRSYADAAFEFKFDDRAVGLCSMRKQGNQKACDNGTISHQLIIAGHITYVYTVYYYWRHD